MRSIRWWEMGWLAVAGLFAGVLLLPINSASSRAVESSADGFIPVAPAAAIHTALRLNLKITNDWLDERDYASAAQSAHVLLALAQLYSHQSTAPRWRDRTGALREALGRLLAAARAKDAAGCRKAVQECDALLTELAKDPPPAARTADPAFKPVGDLRHWMLLLDGTYADAKTADSKETEHLAYTIAEGANAVQYLRSDPRWREKAATVRQAALQAAKLAHEGELAPAR